MRVFFMAGCVVQISWLDFGQKMAESYMGYVVEQIIIPEVYQRHTKDIPEAYQRYTRDMVVKYYKRGFQK